MYVEKEIRLAASTLMALVKTPNGFTQQRVEAVLRSMTAALVAPAAPRQTLFDLVAGHLEHERIKHEKSDNYTMNVVNSWTPYELLSGISDAIETIRSE